MIALYRTREGDGGAAVEERLAELCLAHETVVAESAADLPEGLCDAGGLPVLVDEHDVFVGAEAILGHLEALEAYRAQWYKYQSDVCYCDEEGNAEC